MPSRYSAATLTRVASSHRRNEYIAACSQGGDGAPPSHDPAILIQEQFIAMAQDAARLLSAREASARFESQ
jgi:hypothetical protein